MGSATLDFQDLSGSEAKGSLFLATAGNTQNNNIKEEFIFVSKETVGRSRYHLKLAKVVYLHLKMSQH